MKQIVSSNGLMRCLVLQLRNLDYQATEAKNSYALIPQTAYNIYTQNFVPDLFFLQQLDPYLCVTSSSGFYFSYSLIGCTINAYNSTKYHRIISYKELIMTGVFQVDHKSMFTISC